MELSKMGSREKEEGVNKFKSRVIQVAVLLV
jgi:hypothetical protein